MESDLDVRQDEHVWTLTIRRPPHNFVNIEVFERLADTLEQLDAQPQCRAVVLASEGKSFCAGADFSSSLEGGQMLDSARLYAQGLRLFRFCKPIVAAVHGAAIGAGVGLALAADFRVTCPSTRFSVNFNRLGFHPGFGLSHTLPRLIGLQKAALLFYTGRRIGGAEAVAIGLADELADDGEVHRHAAELAKQIATSAPLAVQSTRQTLRQSIADEVEAALQRELGIQRDQFKSADFIEGVAAMAARRTPIFRGS